jgi:hypothetical protein
MMARELAPSGCYQVWVWYTLRLPIAGICTWHTAIGGAGERVRTTHDLSDMPGGCSKVRMIVAETFGA